MTDDLLDRDKDAAENKLTYVTLLGTEETRRQIDSLRSDIHGILSEYSGEAAAYLAALTDRVAVRNV